MRDKSLEQYIDDYDRVLDEGGSVVELYNQSTDKVKNDLKFIRFCLTKGYKVYDHLPDEVKKSTDIGLFYLMQVCTKSFSYGDVGPGFGLLPEEQRKDFNFIQDALQRGLCIYSYLCDELKQNRDLSLLAAKKNPRILKSIPAGFAGDKEFLQSVALANPRAIVWMSEDLFSDKVFVYQCLSSSPPCLEYMPRTVKQDIELVRVAVQAKGEVLQFAGDALKNNENIVRAAIEQNPKAIRYVGEKLKKDQLIVLAAVERSGYVLAMVNDEHKDDEVIVRAAVSNDPEAIQYASKRLRGEKEIVALAVEQRGCLIRYADDLIKKDEAFFLSKVRCKGLAFEYLTNRLKNSFNCVMAAVEDWPYALLRASDEMKVNKEIVSAAVRLDGGVLPYASVEMRDDEEVVSSALATTTVPLLGCVSERLRNNRMIVMQAVMTFPGELKYASRDLRSDLGVVLCAVGKSALNHRYAGSLIRKQYPGLWLLARISGARNLQVDMDIIIKDKDLRTLWCDEIDYYDATAHKLRRRSIVYFLQDPVMSFSRAFLYKKHASTLEDFMALMIRALTHTEFSSSGVGEKIVACLNVFDFARVFMVLVKRITAHGALEQQSGKASPEAVSTDVEESNVLSP
jgi:hypothetical protein